MADERLILTKTAAASWLGVTPQTFSGYLAQGQIEPHSIIGSGVRAKIDITRAVSDLRRNLSPDQLDGGNRCVRLSYKAPAWWT
jgi:hypothetical protein